MDESSKLALFEKTVVPHLKAAFNLAAWMIRNPHDAEDLVQESYIKAFRYFEGFKGGDGRAWVLAIVRNTCLTWLRQKGAGAPTQLFDERLHTGAGQWSNPEETLLNQSDAARLRECIEALPLEYREALVMRELEELSYKEIAEMAAVPMGTIMSRLSRARKRLQDCLTRTSGAPE
jgi:RNA polymerase sigma-70 factor (ECF subfamily)